MFSHILPKYLIVGNFAVSLPSCTYFGGDVKKNKKLLLKNRQSCFSPLVFCIELVTKQKTSSPLSCLHRGWSCPK